MAPPSTLAMGRYRMLRRLGTGGMGEVYLATAEGPDGVQKQVAIKLVRDDLLSSSELTDLFVEEAKVAFVLTHPNVVHSYEMAQVDDHHFLVMEYVEGTNLADLLVRWREERGEPIPMGVSLYIGAQVARGLEYAHTLAGVEGHPLGIVHRDVSPGNVLISKDGQVKVADFGLAKSALRSVQSRAGVVKGKLAYMPPEQLAGEEVGVQGDLYALGATLYELLCGENPFGPLHEVDVGRRLERTVIPPLAERRSDLDPRVAELVHRCLAYRAEERPTSAREICRGLEQVAQGLGLSATDYDLAELISGEKEKPDQGPVGDAHPFDRVLGLELERVTEAGAESTYAAVGAKKGSLSTALESADVSSPDREGGAHRLL